jgi:hypothetical protein
MTLPSERTLAKDQPIAKFRIVQRHGCGKATIEYTDCRSSAVQHAQEVGGEVECYVYGIGWEPIGKVAE